MNPLDRIFGPDALELLDGFVRDRVETILRERESERRWLTVAETAVYLGISEQAVYHRVRRGSLPYVRESGRLLIDRQALDRRLAERVR